MADAERPRSSSRREAIPGYGLLIEDDGDYVKKKMSQSTGEEILTELICQLGFDDILCEVPTTTDVTTVMMPYASSLFSRRIPADRPQGAPRPSREFAFLGQFTDLPEDVVFAVEYSVHGAMYAVYRLFGVDREIRRSTTGSSTQRSALLRSSKVA